MRFDWYSATIPGTDHVQAYRQLEAQFPHAVWSPSKPVNGFDHAAVAEYGGERFLAMMYGQRHQGVFVMTSGEAANQVARGLRDLWPSHAVSRADACEDFTGAGTWDKLYSVGTTVADQCGVSTSLHGDFRGMQKGRTLYIGSPSSPVSARVYEKGKQLFQAGVITADLEQVRVEVQVRPQKQGKYAAASLSAAGMFGTARWSSKLYEAIYGAEVAVVKVSNFHKPTDFEAKQRAMFRQYGAVCAFMLAECGGDFSAYGESHATAYRAYLAEVEAAAAASEVKQ